MANLNYMGSLAQRKMRFTSTTDVIVNNSDELFHALTIYIPKRFADTNILGWNNGLSADGERLVTADKPAVYVAVVENYAGIMTGDLLTQWQPIFRQDTNGDVILYLVIFDDEQTDSWTIGTTQIDYAPLTSAFNALFSFSYFKFLFDPSYDGRNFTVPASPGTKASMNIRLTNRSRLGAYASQDMVFTNTSQPVEGMPGRIIADLFNSGNDTPAVRGVFQVIATNNGTTDITIPLGIPTVYTDGLAVGSNSPKAYTISGGGGMMGTTITAGSSVTFTASQTTPGADAVFPAAGDAITMYIGTLPSPTYDSSTVADLEVVVGPDGMTVPADMVPYYVDINTPVVLTCKHNSTTTYQYNYSSMTAPIHLRAQTSISLTFNGMFNDPDPDWADSGPLVIGGLMGTVSPDLTLTQTGGYNAVADVEGVAVTLSEGSYAYDDGARVWSFEVPQDTTIAVGGNVTITGVQATTVGYDVNLLEGQDITGLFYGETIPSADILVTSTNIFPGEDPGAGSTVSITAGTYAYNDGMKVFPIVVSSTITMNPDDFSSEITVEASTVGVDSNLGLNLGADGSINRANIQPQLPIGVDVLVYGTAQGTETILNPTSMPSQYFDFSLALATLCRNNIALSWFWSLVGISYEGQNPSPRDKCYIRYSTREEQLANMTSIDTGEVMRARYYWSALYLLACQNTSVIVHSRDSTPAPTAINPNPADPNVTFIIADILAAWFSRKNESGTYIGNKLSLLRLSGTRIKPLGWPSWLDSSVRENDTGKHQTALGPVNAVDMLDDMNVGYLYTIASNTPQESSLSMARGVGDPDKGIPVTMMMISKFVDYTCSQEAAKMVTDEGTLTNPVSADEVAYSSIQLLVARSLGRFANTNGRIYGVTMMFPDFSVARVSRTALSASSAWKAWYKDDLDQVEVSGGIIAN